MPGQSITAQVFERYGRHLNHIHLTALLSGLAKTAPYSSPSTSSGESQAFLSLFEEALTLVSAAQLTQLGPREVSTVVWAAAKAGIPLLRSRGSGAMSPPSSSSSSSSSWLPRLMSRASQLSKRLNPQDMSMLLWALATLSESSSEPVSSPHFTTQATKARDAAPYPEPNLPSFPSPSGRGNSLHLPPGFLDRMLGASAARMDQFGAQALSNTLWALAKLGCRPEDAWLDLAMMRMEVICVGGVQGRDTGNE